ncbi:MAG TPA: GAF domain-containing sensor histidine kinase [Clostridia bacterium]|nr:GAF domain-containing sensor histidine kinase [Clostridia bacterium]
MFDAALASVRAEALLTATNRFLRSADLQALAAALVEAAESMFAPSHAAVVVRTTQDGARVLASAGPRPASAQGVDAQRLGRVLVERALDGQELSTDDPDAEAFRERVRAYGAVSGLAIPIPAASGIGGALIILYATAPSIDERIRELARSLCAQAGIAMELITARDELGRHTSLTSALLQVSQRLAVLTSPDDVPHVLVDAIATATGASLALVARWDAETERVEFTAITGLSTEEEAALRAFEPVADRFGMVQGGLAGKSAVLVPPFDPEDIPIPFVESLGVTALAGAPITVEDHVWGFLVVATRAGDPSIAETGAELLTGFATMTATALGRTEAVAALARSHEFLESAIADRTRQLTQALEELRRADSARSELLSNVSHELRTPLTAILGFTDLLLHGLEGPLTGAQQEDLRTIEASGGRLLGLIDDLIDVSGLESAGVQLRVEPVPLVRFLAALADEVRPLAERRGLSLELSIADAPDVVHADAARLRAIVGNLLSNAVKFTLPRGSIVIEAARLPDGGVRIDVVDTGIGIAAAEQERVFERFHRAAAPDVPGTGLGLAIAREYARLHGGEVSVESSPGAGSRFSLRLPAPAPAAADE